MNQIFDTSFAPINKAAADLRNTRMQQPLQLEVNGPSAQTINSGSSNMSRASFYARRGLNNTAKNIVNNIQKDKKIREDKAAYENYLAAGERGADNLYNEMVKTYGEDIKQWIPPKELFYDNDGVFSPHKYAQSVFLGFLKYNEKLEKLKELQRKKGEFQTISGAIANAQSPQEAAATIAAQGINPEDYSKSYQTIPTIGDRSAVQLNQEKMSTEKSNQELKRAQADWYRRRKDNSGSGSNTPEKDYHFEQAKNAYKAAISEKNKAEATLKNLRRQRLDYEKLGMTEQISTIDEQIATTEADLQVARNNLKRESAALNTLASTKSTEGRKVVWDAAMTTEVDPAVERIVSIISENLKMNQGDPRYNVQEHIKGYIDHYTKNLDMDPLLMEEVRKSLLRKYSSRGSKAPSQQVQPSQPQPSSGTGYDPQVEQKVRELWAKRGINNPTPQQMQSGITSVLRQMGQQ